MTHNVGETTSIIDNKDLKLLPNINVGVTILTAEHNNVLVAPREAVFEENGSPVVFLQGPEGWIRKPVELGVVNFTTVAIHSGVKKGDVIVLPSNIEHGGRIREVDCKAIDIFCPPRIDYIEKHRKALDAQRANERRG